uniref:Uncharacterized protein n=1 Tax=Meloidogyne enterolobii TaxID=390850 RepID=A0A6V7UN92_MELEN|nr:unnamed protein product [Meloidogyne enterolobii]
MGPHIAAISPPIWIKIFPLPNIPNNSYYHSKAFYTQIPHLHGSYELKIQQKAVCIF